MLAIAVDPNQNILINKTAKPAIKAGEALIKTLGCGICGTDLLKINLKLIKQTTILGHEIVGEIVEIDAGHPSFQKGDRVVVAHHVPCFECHYCAHENFSMCRTFKSTNLDPGGFAEFVRLSADHLKHTTFKIPQHVDWRDAIFTEPLACCVRNVDRLNLLSGDVVVVVGLGSIGLMMTKLLNNMGCTVFGVDLDAKRLDNAKLYGLQYGATSVDLEALQKLTDKRLADAVIFTAGPASLLNQSLSWVRDGGAVNLFSHLSGEMANLDTAQLYHRELQIVTTYSPSPDALRKSFELICNADLNLKRMFTEVKPDDFSGAINQLNAKNIHKALVVFNREQC